MLEGRKLLITGATGQVGGPLARSLALANEVWAIGRFGDASARADLERVGVTCVRADFADLDTHGLPTDFDYLLNFAVLKGRDWVHDLDTNAGGLGAMMHHCRTARAVLHCSSTSVYQPKAGPLLETDPLGDSHRVWTFIETYSMSKIASEVMARFCSHQLDLPTTIARLNVPYGDGGGWPATHLDAMIAGEPVVVFEGDATIYNPIHDDDIAEMVPALLDIASVPGTVVNWGGDDAVSIEEWSTYLGELTGLEPDFVHTRETLPSIEVDLTLMHDLVGHTTVAWRDGFRRMVAALYPQRLIAAPDPTI